VVKSSHLHKADRLFYMGMHMSSSAQSGISYEAINKKNESVITLRVIS
jgi:hypothetical protein